MSQKLPVTNFKLKEKISQFNEDFKKSYNEKRDKRHFLEVDVQYPEKLHELHIIMTCHFYQKEWNLEK